MLEVINAYMPDQVVSKPQVDIDYWAKGIGRIYDPVRAWSPFDSKVTHSLAADNDPWSLK
jgi:hypothetical protein